MYRQDIPLWMQKSAEQVSSYLRIHGTLDEQLPSDIESFFERRTPSIKMDRAPSEDIRKFREKLFRLKIAKHYSTYDPPDSQTIVPNWYKMTYRMVSLLVNTGEGCVTNIPTKEEAIQIAKLTDPKVAEYLETEDGMNMFIGNYNFHYDARFEDDEDSGY